MTRGYIQVKESDDEFGPSYAEAYNVMEVAEKKFTVRSARSGMRSVWRVHRKCLLRSPTSRRQMDWAGLSDEMCPSRPPSKFEGKSDLIDSNKQWVSREDVKYRGVVTAVGNRPLGVSGGRIGPEIGFGHAVGNFMDEPFLF